MVDTIYLPKQGDIVWLVFDPRVGHEQSGRRPAIVLSDELLTQHTGLAIVCPITNTVKGFPFEVVLEKTRTKGAVLPIQIRSVDVQARHIAFIEPAPRYIVDTVLSHVQSLLGR